MSQLVENDPLVMDAVDELRRFSADPDMRELERRRKLWKLEYYSGLEAAREEGEAEGILMVLEVRFKTIPKDIENRVRLVVDLVALESLAECAKTCGSLEEFQKALK